jgi:hypothetical protein
VTKKGMILPENLKNSANFTIFTFCMIFPLFLCIAACLQAKIEVIFSMKKILKNFP